MTVDRLLSTVAEPLALNIDGQLSRSLEGAKLVVRVKGPAELAQVGDSAPDLVEVNKIVKVLGEVPPPPTTATVSTATGAGSLPAATSSTTTSSTTTTSLAAVSSTAADLKTGTLKAEVQLPAGMAAEPGAYLLVVEVKSEQDVWASGQLWIGKAEPRETPLDIAFVWPAALGIHRDADDVYYDQVLEEAVASESGDLRALLDLPGRFPDWDLTVAVEPVLLTQLRDMADGYARWDATGARVDVEEGTAAAQSAAAALEDFRGMAGSGSVQIAVGPYSGADLSTLSAEGWRDGFEQIQMGKQELQQALGVGRPLTGARSPDLELTTDSLSYYADASIDHVVVGSHLAGLLTEEIEEATVAVRARDAENDRVTLILADRTLGDAMTGSWDVGTFCAVLAAQLAAAPRDAVVVSPRVGFSLAPGPFLEGLGEVLEQTDWIDSQTLSGLLRSHSPGTRPILLKTSAGGAHGYIEESLMAGLRDAHAAVADLAAIADATRTSVETARRMLYMAESRWWSRDDASPREATIGLEYSRRAQELAEGELEKVRFSGVGSTVITGREGVIDLELQNDAGYPFTVALEVWGEGISFPEGGGSDVSLDPGKTTLQVKVRSEDGPHTLAARLGAGSRTLDEVSHSLRFITIGTVLPALIVGGLIVLAGLFFLVRWAVRKYYRHRRPATS
ncbi:MAG: hypothetical protein JW990_03545 [Thermoleophilia bacterium]|nr:hypothetical protein [Thermoleophilia bacterium]